MPFFRFHALRPLSRRARPSPSPSAPRVLHRRRDGGARPAPRRLQSTGPPPPPPPPADARPSSSLDRLISRLPRRLRPYVAELRAAPVTHGVAFLVLHEVTALVPLLGLFALFHYTAALGPAREWVGRHWDGYVAEGEGRWDRFLRRKGWTTVEVEEEGEVVVADGEDDGTGGGNSGKNVVLSDEHMKIVVELAVAYAINKVIMPLRILLSLRLTPWFAGVLGRWKRFGR